MLAHDVARATGPQPVELAAWRDALSDGTVLRAAVLATFPAAHRVDQTLALPLVDARAKLEAALTVRVRL